MTDIGQIKLQAELASTAKTVCDLQQQFDTTHHDMTTADFFHEHGVEEAEAICKRKLGNIDARRTEAIWARGRALAAIVKGADGA